jgi:benzodiazapine receptor
MDYLVFATYLAACGAAAATGAVFSPGPWYRGLKKPVWTPKDWMFPVVWTALYFFMAGAATIASQVEGSRVALAFWALQIALNTLWTPIFFGLRRIRAGMLVMTFLWLAVLATTVSLAMVSTLAGLLFAPYLLWVTVAGALNFWVMRNNADTGFDGAASGA